jgi:hypothetical protein
MASIIKPRLNLALLRSNSGRDIGLRCYRFHFVSFFFVGTNSRQPNHLDAHPEHPHLLWISFVICMLNLDFFHASGLAIAYLNLTHSIRRFSSSHNPVRKMLLWNNPCQSPIRKPNFRKNFFAFSPLKSYIPSL